MKPLRAALAPTLFFALALPAGAAEISLSEISAYFNGLTTATTEFTQENDDGSTASGRLFLKRPGRARFEYAPPERTLVLASSGSVAIFDAKSNEPPEQYPLRRTPLNLILAQKVDLAQAKMVVGHRVEGDTTRVTAQDPEHPEYGTIELVFTADPVELRQWVIIDDSGGQTTVTLGKLQKGGDISSDLFDISAQMARGNR